MNFLEEYSIFDYWGDSNVNNSLDIFPIGSGWETSLRALANFPNEQKLYRFEYVENFMTLFVNIDPKNYKGKIENEKLYKVAIYNDDLIELKNLGYIEGIKTISEFEYDVRKYNYLVNKGMLTDKSGNIKHKLISDDKEFVFEFNRPDIIEYVKKEFCINNINSLSPNDINDLIIEYKKLNNNFIEIEDFICVTINGWEKLIEISKNFLVPQTIKTIISPLIEIKYYSTAVREISIFLEVKLRKFHEKDLWGDKLIEFHINTCKSILDNEFNAGLKVYRQELRSMNKFIRNEFMHNLFEINQDNFSAILHRMCRLNNMIEIAFARLKKNI